MMPQNFMQIEKMPITGSGKIDRKKLLQIELDSVDSYISPETEEQKAMCKIWKKLLKISKIGIDDNFFEIGGDSIISMKLQIEAMEQGINISYADIFTYPTIRELTSVIKKQTQNLDIVNYDYTKAHELLSKNAKENIKENGNGKIGNLLLFGATGFLGAHILANFLENEKGTIYCIVRNKETEEYSKRVKKTNKFYFGEKYDNIWYERVKIVQGDITKKYFGMKMKLWDM